MRRLLYGLLLAAAAPGAAAADELAYVGKFRPAAKNCAPCQHLVQATLEGMVVLRAQRVEAPNAPIQGDAYPHLALESVTARVFDASAASNVALVKVAVADTGSIKDGVGFDMSLPDLGNFHLNLYSRRNARTEGRRWAMNLADGVERKTWSVGGSLDLVRALDGGRHVAFVPELLFDLDDSGTSLLPFQAAVRYGNWRSVLDNKAQDEKVPQITFKWRL